MRSRALVVLVAAAAVGLVDCRAATEITVHVTTDAPCSGVKTIAGTADVANRSHVTNDCAGAGEIGTIVFVPSGDKGAHVQIVVATSLAGADPATCDVKPVPRGCIVARRGLRFLPHESLRLEVPMRTSCAGVTCNDPEHETCVAGSCVADEIESSSCTGDGCGEAALPAPDGGAPDGGAPDGGVDAGDAAPRTDAGAFGASHLAVGGDATCAIDRDLGTVKCWGDNTYGQLGAPTPAFSPIPVQVPLPNLQAVWIAVGRQHACAVLQNGQVFCWGDRASGKIGDGQETGTAIPVAVPGVSAAQVTAGTTHTCTLGSGVMCWGGNLKGELGQGIQSNVILGPVPVALTETVTQLMAGYSNTCALVTSGVKCWGDNSSGQIGDGTTNNVRPSPTQVLGLDAPSQMAVGDRHACALIADPGSGVVCWGDNASGELGIGTFSGSGSLTPIAPNLGARPAFVAALRTDVNGGTCAIFPGGNAQCWGRNLGGELGDGTSADANLPVDVKSLAGAVEIAGGAHHSCALLATGGLRCWGTNNLGQLGDGTTASHFALGSAVVGFP